MRSARSQLLGQAAMGRPAAIAQVRRSAAQSQYLAPTELLITRRTERHGVTSSYRQRIGNTGAAFDFFAEELSLAPSRARGQGQRPDFIGITQFGRSCVYMMSTRK